MGSGADYDFDYLALAYDDTDWSKERTTWFQQPNVRVQRVRGAATKARVDELARERAADGGAAGSGCGLIRARG